MNPKVRLIGEFCTLRTQTGSLHKDRELAESSDIAAAAKTEGLADFKSTNKGKVMQKAGTGGL